MTGPHPKVLETGPTYVLVAVAALEGGLNLVHAVPMKDKVSISVLSATQQVLAKLRPLYGFFWPITQVHSDCGGEFVADLFKRAMQELGVTQSTTQPGDPAQNGRAERYVGLVKQKAIAMLQEGKLPLSLWSHVIRHASFLMRQSALKRALPEKFPCPGDCVIVPARDAAVREGGDFQPKVRYGLFLCVDEAIPEGAVVAVREDNNTLFLHVSGPKKWPCRSKAVAHACASNRAKQSGLGVNGGGCGLDGAPH